uniref:Uncharacterized protein n=1 Tax=Rheinheimera sp. BAL341 TaxID=1708203 RepID=A0A486XWK8_9GAMM
MLNHVDSGIDNYLTIAMFMACALMTFSSSSFNAISLQMV